jgi:uncharacterized protein (TIGR03118 family)
LVVVSVASILALGVATPVRAQYVQRNLVSDGALPADHVDSDLVNAWGLAASPTSPWWVANNGTNVATIYTGAGVKQSLTVSVPGAPTGEVFNAGSGFVVSAGSVHGPAHFIFSTEGGTILGWAGGTSAIVAYDNSATGAVYKGLAIAHTIAGDFLYATNFHAGTVDVLDSTFTPVHTGGFVDPDIPAGYAPFGIQNLGGLIYVTYAMQDADAHDDVPGPGHGFVDQYDAAGNLLSRIASRGRLNSPWGLAVAPSRFASASGDLLVGNFGNGLINAFDPRRGANGEFQSLGPLMTTAGTTVVIPGLWSLQFGNGHKAGPTTTLFFTAGPFDESHGLFGSITASTP